MKTKRKFSPFKSFLLISFFFPFFSIRVFFSWILTTHRTAGEERGPSLPLPSFPLCHFHPFTNVQAFICNFAREMTITYFYQCLYLPDCYSMRFTTLSNYYLIDWWCNVDFRLFGCWFDFRFCYSYFTWETGGFELTSTISLYYKRTD